MAIAKCLVILTICVLQCLARPENEPNVAQRVKRASGLRGEESETEEKVAKFAFVDSDEDLDSSFDPYLGAITPSLKMPKETQPTQTQEINLRSLISTIPGSETPEKPSSLPETNSKADGLARTANKDQLEEAAENTGLRSLPTTNLTELEKSLAGKLDKKTLEELAKKAFEPFVATIKDFKDPQVRSLLGVITTPFDIVKELVEGVIHMVRQLVRKVGLKVVRILHWVLPNWIYEAVIPRHVLRMIEAENQIWRMSLAARAYEVNYRSPAQKMTNEAFKEGTLQQRPLNYPRLTARIHSGKQSRVE